MKYKGNTTLTIIYEGIQSIAMLDSSASISIATKSTWKKWEKPTIKCRRMNLQLVDGNVQNPIGCLESILVTSCGM